MNYVSMRTRKRLDEFHVIFSNGPETRCTKSTPASVILGKINVYVRSLNNSKLDCPRRR